MPYQPETPEEIEKSVQTEITNQAPSITAWFKKTSNTAVSEVLGEGFADRENELLYVWLVSNLRFAGKRIVEDDLRAIGLDPTAVDLGAINALQSDFDLDAAAADRGVTRLPGSYARGEIIVTLASAGDSARSGFEVTAPDPDGDGTLRYVTTDVAQAAENATTATVPVRAVERGTRYNTGAERIQGLPNQRPAEVQSVINPDPVTGGEGEESNAELRERARGASLEDANLKQRVIAALNSVGAGGGVTGDGIIVQEFPDPSVPESQHGYPYGNLIIDYNGPTDSLVDSDGESVADLQGLVDAERALGIKVYYVAPEVHTLDVTAEVAPDEPSQTSATPSDINTAQIETAILQHIDGRGLGDDLYSAHLESAMTGADDAVAYAPTLSMTLTAPGGTSTSVARSSRASVAADEKIQPGDITVTAVPNP